MQSLIIIPARGGSKGVPRKNLRPLLNKPLISYTIEAALGVKNAIVVVSTDDDEIAMFARRFGAKVSMRPAELAADHITIDPVVEYATKQIEEEYNQKFDIVLTIQATAPLLKSENIEEVIKMMHDNKIIDTVLSVVEDKHLRWRKTDWAFQPDYLARVNRQELPDTYRENGAIIACRRSVLASGTRIGKNVEPYIMPAKMSVDIDNAIDFQIVEALLKRKNIVISVTGNQVNGMGHVYRGLLLAHELIAYDVTFLCEESDDLALNYIQKNNYKIITCKDGERVRTIISLKPDMVINDILDTKEEDIKAFKDANIRVVNFEDMGSGAGEAQVVINALYPHQKHEKYVYTGEKYFCLRSEFMYSTKEEAKNKVENILLTFGGVDEGDILCRTLSVIGEYIKNNNIKVDVVLGPGYIHHKTLEQTVNQLNTNLINVNPATSCISEFMIKSDICITSGGRTVLELTALKIPTIVICQNDRETTHSFASKENGILNLGHRNKLSDTDLLDNFTKVVEQEDVRLEMIKKMQAVDVSKGTKRVTGLITSLFEE